MAAAADSTERAVKPSPARTTLPTGTSLRVKPVLVYHLDRRSEKTSWRGYGGLVTEAGVEAERAQVESDVRGLATRAEFPVDVQPIDLVHNEESARKAAASDADVLLVFAAGGGTGLYEVLSASPAPNIMFLRHKTKPYYLWHEIAHWRFLRRNEDAIVEPHMDVDDIVVDDYDEVMWRLRALYGLKNARGTKMLAIGSLAAYSGPGQENGPRVAQDLWGYEIEVVPRDDFAQRLQKARTDEQAMKAAERQTEAFLNRPHVTLKTERKFVVNSFLALDICKELLKEKEAFNFGFDHCMGSDVIGMLDTPPCLILALANDDGYTAYCHTDLTHTMPGVLLRWITGKPTFVCNTHYPHDGIFTVAHCAAPMKMNGVDNDPADIMTHYESDYGAATKVHYPNGQIVTVVIPNLHCTKWQGFRGRIIDSPSLPVCRSQMDIEIDGDERGLLTEMEGFHAQVVYGDYLREVGYALKKLGELEWKSYTEIS